MRRRRLTTAVLASAASALLVLTACGGGSSKGGSGNNNAAPPVPNVPKLQSLGATEGSLNIIAWAGYAENGSNDKTVDWVHPFEKATKCKVNVKIGNTSDE